MTDEQRAPEMNTHHRLTIKPHYRTKKDQPSSFHNVTLCLDGKEWLGITSLNLEILPGELAKLTVTMFAELDVDDISVGVIKSDDSS